jgi:hypothetical protein
MKRVLGLALLVAFSFGSGSAFGSDLAVVSNHDTAAVTSVAYRHHRHRRRVRRLRWYRARDGRWHRHYVYVYVWV